MSRDQKSAWHAIKIGVLSILIIAVFAIPFAIYHAATLQLSGKTRSFLGTMGGIVAFLVIWWGAQFAWESWRDRKKSKYSTLPPEDEMTSY